MEKYLYLKKQGTFYITTDDDAYILHFIFGYKIIKGRVGFPLNSLGKVTAGLETHKINYTITENDKVVEKQKFPSNNYLEYVQKGKNKYNASADTLELIDKVKNMSDDKIHLIIDFIKEVVSS